MPLGYHLDGIKRQRIMHIVDLKEKSNIVNGGSLFNPNLIHSIQLLSFIPTLYSFTQHYEMDCICNHI
jgi:hypothetical protein